MNDTIAAIATPAGRGGVGIVRISGPLCRDICQQLVTCVPEPRYAYFCSFNNAKGVKLDEGLALFFPGPNSFTGEDVLELQGHGGPIVLDMLLQRVLSLGARMARAGEFSERAFLNNKMDLIQAEAVAQLIDANSEQAAIAAMRSLQGDFSKAIDDMVADLVELRMYVEAAIDFPEEEINFLADKKIIDSVDNILSKLENTLKTAEQGALLAEGVNTVIIGKPNVGKSTLLNKLTGYDTAIVTPIAGTTRDAISAQVNVDGLQLNIVDTAGLHETEDLVEKAGIARTWKALDLADLVLLVIDSTVGTKVDYMSTYPQLVNKKIIIVYNKIDAANIKAEYIQHDKHAEVYLCANTGDGLDCLSKALHKMANASADACTFIARRRHLDALRLARERVVIGKKHLTESQAGDLLAEELRLAQQDLQEITGSFTSDDLLGKIFSEFCIGK